MDFTQQQAPEGTIIALQGPFTFKDHHTFRVVMDALKAGLGRCHVLDLSGLEFVDSAALGMLLIADDEAKTGGWTLTLRRPPVRVAQLMELSAMDSIFQIEK